MKDYSFDNNSYILGLLLINYSERLENNVYHFVFRNKLLNINIIELFEKIGYITYDIKTVNLYISNKDIIDNINNLLVNDLTEIISQDYINIIQNNIDNSIGFIRALFEHYGCISYFNNLYSFISHEDKKLLETIKDIINIPSNIEKGDNLLTLKYLDVNNIDFLGKLYANIDNNYYDEHFYNDFTNLVNCNISIPVIKVLKTCDNAIIPSKTRMSDAGYDLTIISIYKSFSSKTKLYDTGIKLDIPNGYYVEIVPRSSISKSGYILSNNIGIIDQGYKGNLYVALTKIDDDMPDLTLPFKCCQLLIKKQIYANFIETNKLLEDSNRNIGGFGSTN
jgi:deoxyuridine 5'-triphosphate nucleotidohydrolase